MYVQSNHGKAWKEQLHDNKEHRQRRAEDRAWWNKVEFADVIRWWTWIIDHIKQVCSNEGEWLDQTEQDVTHESLSLEE